MDLELDFAASEVDEEVCVLAGIRICDMGGKNLFLLLTRLLSP